MSVNITYEEQSNNLDEMLLYAQLISDAFTKALDQNECNVKLLIGFAEEIQQGKDELEDIVDIVKEPSKLPDRNEVVDKVSPDIDDIVIRKEPTTINPENIESVIKKLKESCLDCEFGLPTIDFSGNLDFSFQRLKTMLNLYTDVFSKLANPNLCHVAGAFTYACIPSILSLLLLLVSTYSAILALKKLGGISLNAFIKGVISGLLGEIISNLSLRVDTSKTGVGCLINAIREIGDNIKEQGSAISGIIPTEVLAQLGYVPKADKDLTEEEREKLAAEGALSIETQFSQQEYLDIYANLTFDERSIVEKYLGKLESENNKVNNAISSSFKEVGDVLEAMIGNFNENMSQMFGLMDYFQCESERSGAGFTDVLAYMNKLTVVINLLSAIIAIIAKKQIKKLCKTGNSVSEMITIVSEVPLGEPLTDLEEAELIGEFLEKVVDITVNENDEIVPVIYEKAKPTLLPKLSLTSCNLNEFIQGHDIGNIIDKVLEDIVKENIKKGDDSLNDNTNNTVVKKVYPSDSFISDKDNWTKYPIKFERPKKDYIKKDEQTTDIFGEVIKGNVGYNTGLQTILDLIYNNPLDKKTPEKEVTDQSINPPTNNEDSLTDLDFRQFIKTPSHLDLGQKKAFDNKCKDINDVLSILGEIKKT